MARKKGLFMNKASLMEIVSAYCDVVSEEVINELNKQTRYFLKKGDTSFAIDVFYRKDNTITVNSLPLNNGYEYSKELCEIIKSNDDYQDAVSGSFSVKLSFENFQQLTNYLTELSGVTKTSEEDKGDNGLITKFATDYGDAVTLTYYDASSMMYYQGLLMNFYAIIKEFISPLSEDTPKTVLNFGSKKEDKNYLVEQYINENLPEGYALLDPLLQGFVKDTFTLVVANTELSDYAAWVMAIFRVLEQRIKAVCLQNDLIIKDEAGFKYYDENNKLVRLFSPNQGHTVVNRDLSSTLDNETCDILIRCYEYLKANRHELFHATQIVEGIRLVGTPEQAKLMIKASCELIEESLVYNNSVCK